MQTNEYSKLFVCCGIYCGNYGPIDVMCFITKTTSTKFMRVMLWNHAYKKFWQTTNKLGISWQTVIPNKLFNPHYAYAQILQTLASTSRKHHYKVPTNIKITNIQQRKEGYDNLVTTTTGLPNTWPTASQIQQNAVKHQANDVRYMDSEEQIPQFVKIYHVTL